MKKPLKFGVIGTSSGNGHPYSWSAIFNGYNSLAMEACGYPAIPRYLERQNFPQDAIEGAAVTHIYTQERAMSRHIALAANIDHIVDNPWDLIGRVDAILLARDDAENHLEFARPFLEAGLPIYIDKPFALSISDASQMIGLQQYPGQLFSCSAFRYAKELQIYAAEKNRLGDIRSIHGFVPKDWDRYSVHVIEPILGLIPECGDVKRAATWVGSNRKTLVVEFASGVEIQIHTLADASSPIGMRIFGSKAWLDISFEDTFFAFRTALLQFMQGVIMRDVRSSPEQLLSVVSLIELGRSI